MPGAWVRRFRPVVEALEDRTVPTGTSASLASYGQLPLSFEANQGQADAALDFLARGSGYTIGLSADAAYLNLASRGASAPGDSDDQSLPVVLRMQLVGGDATAPAAGLDLQQGISNYFIGNDPSQWRTAIPNYGRVAYDDVYPGIDVVWYGRQRQLEYDFVVAPGADPSQIQLRFDGADSLSLDEHGNLIVHTPAGDLVEHAPVIYQETWPAGGVSPLRNTVAGDYVLDGGNQVSFWVGAYDASRTLVIDPVLSYSTYLGGASFDQGLGIAVDAAGNAFVTGETASADFPTTAGAFDTTFNGGGGDVFVTRLNATGTALVYSTFLGGSGFDQGRGISVDAAGNAFVTGFITSADFPTTAGAFDTTFNGSPDAFVTKLNATGTALVYSTFLGVAGSDQGNGIAVDAAGNAFVTGFTDSAAFPTTAGAFDTTFNGLQDAFVTQLNATGTALVYSTYLGGTGFDVGIALDAAGNAFVTGYSDSADFPTTAGAFDTTVNGGGDGFVTQLNATGTALGYSTFLGGAGYDEGLGIAVDAAGNAFVTGNTESAAFPTTTGAFDTTFNGGVFDAFVTQLNAAGTALGYSTYLGGAGLDQGRGIAVDTAGNAFVTGNSDSAAFPTTAGAFDTTFNGGLYDAFVAQLNAAGSALGYSTYLGGAGNDQGFGIAVDAAGNAFVTGNTSSAAFPTTAGAFDTTFNGDGGDAFVAKFPLVASAIIVTGEGGGGRGRARVFDAKGILQREFVPFPSVRQLGVRVAVGDVTGDDVPDIIAALGPSGAPWVKVINARTFRTVRSFLAFPTSFRGGVYVAAGDVNRDGFDDVIVGKGEDGDSQVKVFSGRNGRLLRNFVAFAGLPTGGVRVAAGDVNRDGFADIITGPGLGGPPRVKVFSGRTGAVIRNFLAFESSFTKGVFVAAGDVNADGFADLIVSRGRGLRPEVRVFDGRTNFRINSFLAYPASFRGAVRVAAADVDGDGRADVLTAAGPDGAPRIKAFDAVSATLLDSFFAFEPDFDGGVFVGAG